MLQLISSLIDLTRVCGHVTPAAVLIGADVFVQVSIFSSVNGGPIPNRQLSTN